MEELKSWTRSRMAATGAFDALHCLDLFGATQRVGRCWRKYGYSSLSDDIKLGGPNHDITSEGGFRALLDMGARLLDSLYMFVRFWLFHIVSPGSSYWYLLVTFHRDTQGSLSISHLWCLPLVWHWHSSLAITSLGWIDVG